MSASEFVKLAQQTLGKESVGYFGDADSEIPALSTGVVGVDQAIRKENGGFPKGRITEIFSPEYYGKTSLALHAIASAQKQGMTAMYVDVEHSLNPLRATQIGVSMKDLIYSQPDSGEQALGLVEMAASSGDIGITVVDSIAGIIPRSELEGDIGDAPMASQARLLSQFMRRAVHPIAKSGMVVVLINQLRASIGSYNAAPQPTGGKAIRYYASLRIQLRSKGRDAEAQPIYELEVIKNKLAVPFGKCQYQINEQGFDDSAQMIKNLVDEGKIIKSGGWYKFGDQTIGQGTKATWENLKENSELFERITGSTH